MSEKLAEKILKKLPAKFFPPFLFFLSFFFPNYLVQVIPFILLMDMLFKFLYFANVWFFFYFSILNFWIPNCIKHFWYYYLIKVLPNFPPLLIFIPFNLLRNTSFYIRWNILLEMRKSEFYPKSYIMQYLSFTIPLKWVREYKSTI